MSGPLAGSLETLSLPAVLRPLIRSRRTGVLRLRRGKIQKTVYLSEGRLIFATSADPDDRLGEMLLRKGLISYRGLEDSVRAIQYGKRQGTILVESGAIRSRDLVEGVSEQVQEIIYSLFTWEEGSYEFAEGPLPSREVIVLRMSTGDLMVRGIRRIGGWNRIRAGVGGLDQRYALTPDSAAVISGMSLQKDELAVVAAIDGAASLEEICAALRGNDFVVCRSVFGLWAAAVLDRVPQDQQPAEALPEKTEPHAERLRGASVGREVDRFNELHRFVFELVTYELGDRAGAFFERAFTRAAIELPALFDEVPVDATGELDPIALRRNILSQEIAAYVRGLDRLLEIEGDLTREMLGERKAGIIQDGLVALKAQQLQSRPPRDQGGA
jgi:Domain of unknown function (DUF4388)